MISFLSIQVFSHFMFGFPPHWEAYEEKCFGKELITGTALFCDYDKSAADPECMLVIYELHI